MIIAITGASGHIGANLCRTLLGRKHQLKILVNRYTESLPKKGPEYIKGNLLDPASLRSLADGTEILIHLAASISINGDRKLFDINVSGTRNVISAVRECKVKRMIHFSSIHAIRHNPLDEVLDEKRPLALDDRILYNRSKAMAEQAVRDAVKDGLDAVIINPTSVMGRLDFRPSLIGQAILQLYQGKIPALVPGGYDWVDVRDVVSGTITAIDKGRSGESYLLSGHYISLPELYEKIRSIKGGGGKLPLIPFWLAGVGVPFLKAWAGITGNKPLYTRESVEILKTAHPEISHAKARMELDYQPRPFEETLNDTIDWFREKHYL
jgi:dihydroflavonol-4-reductase